MNPAPRAPHFLDDAHRQRAVSSLMDGDADADAAARLCAAWRDDVDLRADWHAFSLIGDVLRSEDLAQAGPRDEAFLVALRSRLADEPVVLAPPERTVPLSSDERAAANSGASAAAGGIRRRHAWRAPLAVAAGFVAVAGVLVVTRVEAPLESGGPLLAAAPTRPAISTPVVPVSNEVLVADRTLIRDSRIDRYLAAHKQYGSSSALAVPGVVLRSATTLPPER